MHLTTLALVGALLLGQAAPSTLDIKSANGRLTAHLSQARLRDVVREISRLTGIQVVGDEKLSGSISVEFSDLAPKEAFSRVLAGVNYVIKVPSPAAGDAAEQLVVYVHSMAGAEHALESKREPIHVPALDALVSDEGDEAADEKDADENDSDLDDLRREERFRLERLVGQGAFDSKADTASLVKLLATSGDVDVQLHAVQALSGRPVDSRLLKALLGALDDDSFDVRSAAVEVVGHWTDAASLDATGRLLEKPDDDGHLRVSVLRVIAMRADVASLSHLRAFVEAKETNEAEPLIREAARQIIAELLDRQSKHAR